MLGEIIELFQLLLTLPFVWIFEKYCDFCDRVREKAEAKLTEEEREKRRIAEEERKAEELKKKKEEEQRIIDSIKIEPHLPYSYYQKKRW